MFKDMIHHSGGVETGARILSILWGLADVAYQKTIFDRYYCIKSFCHKNTSKNIFVLL